MTRVRLAVLGAGLIGRRHAEHIVACPATELLAVVDPAPAAAESAERWGAGWYRDFDAMMQSVRPDGVVIATPNQMHVDHGLKAIAAGLPALVEKPIATDAASATRLVEAAEAASIPLLVGHHRRYNPMIRKAHELIQAGRLGRVVSLSGHFWVSKPDDYFDVAWRRQAGAGPVLINLVHDIDLFRYLCGEVTGVQALDSNAVRGNAVEETAVIILRFANGALGTVNVSDAIVAPWSWEMTTGENPIYPRQDQSCYLIGGTQGSLSIPDLEIWANPGKRSWWEPLVRERVPFVPEDPLQAQIRHFADVIRGEATPLVSGREGLRTLTVIEAVKTAALTRALVEIA